MLTNDIPTDNDVDEMMEVVFVEMLRTLTLGSMMVPICVEAIH